MPATQTPATAANLTTWILSRCAGKWNTPECMYTAAVTQRNGFTFSQIETECYALAIAKTMQVKTLMGITAFHAVA